MCALLAKHRLPLLGNRGRVATRGMKCGGGHHPNRIASCSGVRLGVTDRSLPAVAERRRCDSGERSGIGVTRTELCFVSREIHLSLCAFRKYFSHCRSSSKILHTPNRKTNHRQDAARSLELFIVIIIILDSRNLAGAFMLSKLSRERAITQTAESRLLARARAPPLQGNNLRAPLPSLPLSPSVSPLSTSYHNTDRAHRHYSNYRAHTAVGSNRQIYPTRRSRSTWPRTEPDLTD